jgi:hypothetical protein
MVSNMIIISLNHGAFNVLRFKLMEFVITTYCCRSKRTLHVPHYTSPSAVPVHAVLHTEYRTMLVSTVPVERRKRPVEIDCL